MLGSFTSRRSPPGKDPTQPATEDIPPRRRRSHASSGSYQWAPAEVVEVLALRVLYSHGGAVETQQKLYNEVVEQLKWEKEELRVSPGKMRQMLLSSKKIRVEVQYALHALTRPVTSCPVCRKPVMEIRNHTLDTNSVVTGYRCTSCAFWTPLRRRVPSRYSYRVNT